METGRLGCVRQQKLVWRKMAVGRKAALTALVGIRGDRKRWRHCHCRLLSMHVAAHAPALPVATSLCDD